MDREFLAGCLRKGMSLNAIGKQVGKDPSTVGYWMKKHGLSPSGAEKYSPRGALSKEELQVIADTGASLAEMAATLDRSVSTIRYWLRRYEIKTLNTRGRRARCNGGPKTAIFECRRHGRTEFVLEGRGYYRCKRCRATAVAKRRRVIKEVLVEEAGGACQLCGYSRWRGALQFHHVQRDTKAFHLAHRGHSRSIARSREEMRKCVLLCANCHAEVEGGFATLPVDLELLASESWRG